MRVKFLLLLMALFMVQLAPAQQSWMASDAKKPVKGKKEIDYIRPEIPDFKIPIYQGDRYKDKVPDTLDVTERARLTINALTAPTDPAADYELYWAVSFHRNPPMMMHDWNDWVQYKFYESLPLLRTATGDTRNSQVDKAWMASVLKSIGPDGLHYMSMCEARPWCRLNSNVAPGTEDGTGTNVSASKQTQVTAALNNSRLMGAMSVYYMRDHNPMWIEIMKKMTDRLAELVIDKGDWCFIPGGVFAPGHKFPADSKMPTMMSGEENGGRLIQGPVQFYNVSGYEPALRLAGKLTKYLRHHSGYYGADGQWFEGPERKQYGVHFHAHTIGLLSMLDYALAAKDKELVDWIVKSYTWGKEHGKGNPSIGFFPENISEKESKTCETCEIADMIAIAFKLTEAGAGDFHDEADRWIRNQFFEQQLDKIDWIRELSKDGKPQKAAYNESIEKVAERNRGGFAGWAKANEWGNSIMHCCTGNASRAVYYIWENMLSFDKGTLRVNLLLNRASKWADIYSYVPYEGRVDLKIKQELGKVMLHAPEWAAQGDAQVKVTVNGTAREVKWSGRYVDAGSVQPGDKLSMTFPISVRETKETIGMVPYTLKWKGNTVVSIDPPGKLGALYQREYYLKDKAPMVTVERYVPAEQVKW